MGAYREASTRRIRRDQSRDGARCRADGRSRLIKKPATLSPLATVPQQRLPIGFFSETQFPAAAGISFARLLHFHRQPLQSGEKSPLPRFSAASRSGATAPAAIGNAGASAPRSLLSPMPPLRPRTNRPDLGHKPVEKPARRSPG